MAALLSSLPQPTQRYVGPVAAAAPEPAASGPVKEVPPYLKRSKFVPRRDEDFGGGGAFPEIHVAQYPLGMGRPDAVRSSKTLALTVSNSGEVAYDALLRQGSNKGKVVHADHLALVPKVDRLTNEALAKPDEEEVDKTVEETQAALDKLVNSKLSAVNPANLPSQPGGPQYIKYTPAQQGQQYNSGASHRIIKMQDMPVDPLEPPKFRHMKVPRGPGSPPVPVMHSPPRPVTAQDQVNWKIPPCISNWKNAKGYTIPLDKRLAADGRGLQQTVINDKFAALSESLFVAENKARESLTMRQQVQKEIMMKEKAKKEAELRELAMKARLERGGGLASRLDPTTTATALPGPPPGPPPPGARGSESPDGYRAGGRDGGRGGGRGRDDRSDDDGDLPPPPPRGGYEGGERETAQEREERRKRDEIREERRRERERERRLEAKDAGGNKKSKLTRDRDRDISEKVALGMAKVTGGEVAYDQRLFNQDQGMSSGFGADDAYGVYDKPLFADRSAAGGLYRPKRGDGDEDGEGGGGGGGGEIRTEKFKADRGFQGTEGAGGAQRSGPVQFERGSTRPREPEQAEEADPFNLDAFMGNLKKGRG